MKRFIATVALATLAAASCSAMAATGVSVSVGQPGFYGQIDVGGYPQPQLVYAQPVMVRPAPYGAAPMYLYAPPGHIKHWSRYCNRYGACNRPVYFVQDRWYRNDYAPRYRREHGYDDRHHHHHRHHDHDDD
jgi:hypothetical protein